MFRIAQAAAITAAAGAVLAVGTGIAAADANAHGAAIGSPGVMSGGLTQAPVHVPVNICGGNLSVIGLLNPAFGNTCQNISGHHNTEDNKGDWNGHNGHQR